METLNADSLILSEVDVLKAPVDFCRYLLVLVCRGPHEVRHEGLLRRADWWKELPTHEEPAAIANDPVSEVFFRVVRDGVESIFPSADLIPGSGTFLFVIGGRALRVDFEAKPRGDTNSIWLRIHGADEAALEAEELAYRCSEMSRPPGKFSRSDGEYYLCSATLRKRRRAEALRRGVDLAKALGAGAAGACVVYLSTGLYSRYGLVGGVASALIGVVGMGLYLGLLLAIAHMWRRIVRRRTRPLLDASRPDL